LAGVWVRDGGSAASAQGYTFTTVAGLGANPGSDDGTGSGARFSQPTGVALDAAGNLLIVDQANSTIRKMTTNGVVTTLAGHPGIIGTNDGTGDLAQFYAPSNLAFDRAGNIYVADTSNHTIRKVTPDGVVTTLAGLGGVPGSDDGTNSSARFNQPNGIALDSHDNIYVADGINNAVRMVTTNGVVTTVAGSAASSGTNDGIGTAALFSFPEQVAVDGADNVYVADAANNTVRKMTPGRVVTTLAGFPGVAGSQDGTGRGARFNFPENVATDRAGNVYVADYGNSTIRKVTTNGVVTTIGGMAGVIGIADGTGSGAQFNAAEGVFVDKVGRVYVADTQNDTIRIGIPATVHNVGIGDDYFYPSSLTIVANDQVKWTWLGSHNHSSTSDTGLWDSGIQGKGHTFTRTFSSVGNFPYHCAVYSFMTGSVTVQPNGPTITITSPANGATFNAHASFTLRATAADSDGSITSVEFLEAATSLTNLASSPYTARVSDLAVGNHTYSARATDHFGRKATNSIVVHVVPDVTRPLVTFVSPASGQRVTNTSSDVIVQARASDNVLVTDVQVQLNGGVWLPAATTNGFTNWSATIAPQAGTNYVSAYATDPSGNRSPTNTLTFDFVVPSTLTLITNGLGGISRSFQGLLLEVGRAYSVTAVPGPGQIFSGWDGSLTSSVPALPFIMQSNMVLAAHFIPNPFLQAQGVYNGLFAEPVRAHERSGFFTLNLADHGAYSASLKRGTNSYSFSGQFNAAGIASKTVNGWVVYLTLDLAGAERITGTVSTGTWAADLLANRYVFNSLTNPASQFMGKYTLIIPGGANSAESPSGHGYGAVTVGPGGYVALSGTLADNFAWSQNVPLSHGGQWACYVPLYGGQGSVWSWLLFDTNQPSAEINGTLSWIRPARPGATYYPLGFTNDAEAQGSRYTAPTNATTRVINLTNGLVIFDGGNLSGPFTNVMTLTATNRFINGSSNSLSFSLVRSNGTFSGSVEVPGTTRTNTFKGAFLQDQDSGYGYFLGTNQSGSVFLGPQP
jgi:plastocyanin